jgi:hypothetical protein
VGFVVALHAAGSFWSLVLFAQDTGHAESARNSSREGWKSGRGHSDVGRCETIELGEYQWWWGKGTTDEDQFVIHVAVWESATSQRYIFLQTNVKFDFLSRQSHSFPSQYFFSQIAHSFLSYFSPNHTLISLHGAQGQTQTKGTGKVQTAH